MFVHYEYVLDPMSRKKRGFKLNLLLTWLQRFVAFPIAQAPPRKINITSKLLHHHTQRQTRNVCLGKSSGRDNYP